MTLIDSVTLLTGATIFVGALLIRALGGAASSILADEFRASAPETAQRIIRVAARMIPEHSREEVLETWLAEASEYEGRPLKALRFALVNCLVAAPGLVRQLRPALAPAGEKDGASRNRPRGSDRRKRRGPSPGSPGAQWLGLWRNIGRLAAHILRGFLALLGPLLALIVRGGREAFDVLGEAGRLSAGMLREIVELLGPYDYSREWRSVLQLVARIVAMILAVSLGVVIVSYVSEVLFGL